MQTERIVLVVALILMGGVILYGISKMIFMIGRHVIRERRVARITGEVTVVDMAHDFLTIRYDLYGKAAPGSVLYIIFQDASDKYFMYHSDDSHPRVKIKEAQVMATPLSTTAHPVAAALYVDNPERLVEGPAMHYYGPGLAGVDNQGFRWLGTSVPSGWYKIADIPFGQTDA